MAILRVKKNGYAGKAKSADKFVVCETESGRFYAKTDGAMLKLCVPNSDGVLLVTDSLVTDVDVIKSQDLGADPVHENAHLKSFNTRPAFNVNRSKKVTVRDEETKHIIDYQKISVGGFASTFAKVTKEDRDGDTIGDGAFTKTISSFMKNPVMLIDHENSVKSIAGSFDRLKAGDMGLEVNATVSNAPELRSVRFLIAEGHLKAFSIGGLFRFSDRNSKMVDEVELFEISLVAVPANPDALFSSRSISVTDAKSAFKKANLVYK